MRTRQQAIDRFCDAIVVTMQAAADMTPREQAEAAWSPASRYTVDELEDLIRAERGMEPLRRGGAA